MITLLYVVLVFALCGTQTDATDCISRQEFEEFKTNVLQQIQNLTLENVKQAKIIKQQRNSILDLKKMLAKPNEVSTYSKPQDSASISNENIPVKTSSSFTKNMLISKPFTKRAVQNKRLLSPQAATTTVVPRDVVAFYAYLTKAETNAGPHHVIVYDHVITNAGNGYNEHTGAFTTSKAGMYVFSWTTFVNPHSFFPIELTLNSHQVGIVFVHGDTTFNGVTGSAVIQLQQDDVVMVRSEPGYNPQGTIYSDENMRTAFSGWCIS